VTSDIGKRAPFELLAFTAAPVAGALVVIELEGRFVVAPAQNGRFSRRPMLVVEPADDRPRLELAPIRAELHDAYWRGAYAIPAEALAGARFALAMRSTLLELPPPDALDGADRLTALTREANSLRRALEAAEAATATAHAEADANAAELGAAVLAARDGALSESSDRIATLEAELAEVHRRATDAEARGTDAEARVRAAEKATRAAEAGTEVLRAELAEERERSRSVTAISDPKPTVSASPHTAHPRGPGPWIAVGALVLFAFVLLGLLAGFLA
jgi:hypothetical protein